MPPAAVLKSMRRGGNADIFLKTIERVRATVPGVAIRSTFITGFPGETEADFAVLSDFVRAAQLDWLGVFSYSDEEGSGAFHLGEKVPARTIEARRRSLMRLQQSISRKSRARQVGRSFDLLVEGPSEETPLLVGGPHRASGTGNRWQGLYQRLWTIRPASTRDSFTSARLPNHRITTWWAGLFCKGTL